MLPACLAISPHCFGRADAGRPVEGFVARYQRRSTTVSSTASDAPAYACSTTAMAINAVARGTLRKSSLKPVLTTARILAATSS